MKTSITLLLFLLAGFINAQCDTITFTLQNTSTIGSFSSFSLYSLDSEEILLTGENFLPDSTASFQVCLTSGCYRINANDFIGLPWTDGTLTISNQQDEVIGNYSMDINSSGNYYFDVNDTSCLGFPGCTDETANNYDADAIIDDSSCYYNCDEGFTQIYLFLSIIDENNLGSFQIFDDNNNLIYSEDEIDGNGSFSSDLCLNDTVCYSLYINNLYFGIQNNVLQIGFTIFAEGTMETQLSIYGPCEDDIEGCMDTEACNYDENATWYNLWLCTFPGCTDASAVNFDSDAGCEDESCFYPGEEIYGCTDPEAMNYNVFANIDNGQCWYNENGCESLFFIYEINTDEGIVELINFSAGDNLSYFWDFGDGATSTEEFPEHDYEIFGTYNLCLTVTNGNETCSDQYCLSLSYDGEGYIIEGSEVIFQGFSIHVISQYITSIEENNSTEESFSVFPNPANNQLFIQFDKFKESLLTIEIVDYSGKIVQQQKITNNSTNSIDVGKLKSGVYFIGIKNKDKVTYKRFSVIK